MEDPCWVLLLVCITWPRLLEKARNPKSTLFFSQRFVSFFSSFFFFFFPSRKQTNKHFTYLSFPQFLGITVPSCNKQFHTPILTHVKKKKKGTFFATTTFIFHTFEKYPKNERDNFCTEERRIITGVGEIVCSILSFFSTNRIRFYPPWPTKPVNVAVASSNSSGNWLTPFAAQNIFILTTQKSNEGNHRKVTELDRYIKKKGLPFH